MMSKRLFSDEPNAPKPLKELFWENAEKARMGNFGKTKRVTESSQKPRGFRQEAFGCSL